MIINGFIIFVMVKDDVKLILVGIIVGKID